MKTHQGAALGGPDGDDSPTKLHWGNVQKVETPEPLGVLQAVCPLRAR